MALCNDHLEIIDVLIGSRIQAENNIWKNVIQFILSVLILHDTLSEISVISNRKQATRFSVIKTEIIKGTRKSLKKNKSCFWKKGWLILNKWQGALILMPTLQRKH